MTTMNATPKRRALLIGINYIGSDCELRGCINDVDRIRNLLIKEYEYKPEDILVLTDLTPIKPTRDNIIKSFTDFLKGNEKGDQLCFYYSGHGTKVIDQNHDERTGYDEAICTYDMRLILDDDILNMLSMLNGANLSMFFDCCHSGTICDLEYNIRYCGNSVSKKPKFEMWTEKSKKINGHVKMFSGCLDTQTSADCQFVRAQNEYCNNGAFTYMFLNIIEKANANKDKLSNRNILMNIYDLLKLSSFEQVPQLSCSSIESLDDIFSL